MRRWGVWIVLMLSLGVNVGVVTMIFSHRRMLRQLAEAPRIEPLGADEPARSEEPRRPDQPALGAEPIGPARPASPRGPSRPDEPAPRPERPGADALRRAEPNLSLLADRLRLRGQARDRFLEAQRRFFAEVTARRVELATLRRELRRELTSPRPDRERIERILERTGRATAALDGAFAENVLAVREILGPRQQRAYFRFLERLRAGQR